MSKMNGEGCNVAEDWLVLHHLKTIHPIYKVYLDHHLRSTQVIGLHLEGQCHHAAVPCLHREPPLNARNRPLWMSNKLFRSVKDCGKNAKINFVKNMTKFLMIDFQVKISLSFFTQRTNQAVRFIPKGPVLKKILTILLEPTTHKTLCYFVVILYSFVLQNNTIPFWSSLKTKSWGNIRIHHAVVSIRLT